jgi:hypothetical protein
VVSFNSSCVMDVFSPHSLMRSIYIWAFASSRKRSQSSLSSPSRYIIERSVSMVVVVQDVQRVIKPYQWRMTYNIRYIRASRLPRLKEASEASPLPCLLISPRQVESHDVHNG